MVSLLFYGFWSSSSIIVNRHVTKADFTAFQQQLRQEMTDVIQKLRVEVNETVSGRMDVMNGIATSLQSVTAHTAPKPYRISDLVPKNWEGSDDKGELRHFSCLTCTCGCKRGRRQCRSTLRALASPTRAVRNN